MSDKFCNIIKMMVLLRRRLWNTGELALELGVDTRTIRYYRQELEGAHVFIQTVRGPKGGYFIGREYDDWLKLTLNPEELSALQLGAKQLESAQFVYQKEMSDALLKLEIIAKRQHQQANFDSIHYTSKASGISDAPDIERTHSREVFEAILIKKKIQIDYYSLSSNKTTTRIVQPYAVFEYKGGLYMVGHCENRNAVIDFKLSRIRKLERIDDAYTIPKDFNLRSYMSGSIGIFKDEPMNVELIIRHPMAQIIREKVWVEGQSIEERESGAIVFKASVKGYTELKSWVLGMGSSVTVVEPEKLRMDIREEAEKILGNY